MCWSCLSTVCQLFGRSVITSCFWAFRAKRRADFSYCPCPAPILPLPTRTWLMLPYIRIYVYTDIFLRKNFLPKCFKKQLKSGFSTPQNTKCRMQDSKCKIPFQFFQMLVINKITCKSFRTSLPPRASRKQLTSCSSTSQNVKSHIPYLLNCVLASAKCLFWIR